MASDRALRLCVDVLHLARSVETCSDELPMRRRESAVLILLQEYRRRAVPMKWLTLRKH